jgi:hypothetical protein
VEAATAPGLPGSTAPGLPELANVPWRPRANETRLRRAGRLWTLSTVGHTVPFLAAAIFLGLAKPVTIPVALVLVAHAWIIPELYASRGAGVLRPGHAAPGQPRAEHVALGLLGDLVGHDSRERYAETGLILEPGTLGVWLVAQAGALLVRPGGRRVHCYCVKATDPTLPAGDRVAHLLLALRTDETGFATVANLAFSGACWRLRRRVPESARPALLAAARRARAIPAPECPSAERLSG